MQTHTSVTKRLAAIAAAAATCAAVGLVAVPAQASAVQPTELAVQLARPTRIGPVTGLAVLSVTKPGDAYSVKVGWNSLTGATAYDVSMIYAGTVLSKARVTQPSWTTTTTRNAKDTLTFKVVPVAAKRRGVAATTSLVLPDLTAPAGNYTLVLDGTTATVTQDSLSDDVTPTDLIGRSIDWLGDGSFTAWSSGLSTSYDYQGLGLWRPQLRLVDEAGNERVLALKTVVIGDETAPVGTYSIGLLSAWAKYSSVVLTETSLSDDYSRREDVVRVVDWNDGTAPTQWTAGTTLSHVYQVGGSFTPSVHLVDEAGNAADVAAQTVTVKVDSAAPKVTVRVPTRKAAYVSSWKTLRGTARDPFGTGVRQVQVRVVQKRGTSWYAYRAPSKRWVRAGSTRASAMRQTRAAVAVWKQGRWSTSVARLRKGTLVVSAQATDRVGNTSKPVAVKKLLTRW